MEMGICEFLGKDMDERVVYNRRGRKSSKSNEQLDNEREGKVIHYK